MKERVFVVTKGAWNHQNGAGDFGYYWFHPMKCFKTYSEALKYVGIQGFEYYIPGDGWWTGNGLLTITEMEVE